MFEKLPRILLIYPPSQTQSHLSCPMGIMMLAAVLEKAGYDVHILDANAARKKRSTKQIIQICSELKPDIIGITVLTPMVKEAYRLASGLQNNGAKLIAGGPHATILPEELLSNGFDAVVLGEGEITIEKAVKALLGILPKDEVRGWVYRDSDGQPKRTNPQPLITNLDDLPFPAWHLVNPLYYGPSQNKTLHTNLFSSRGCPARCTFCTGHLFGKSFRFRSAQNVLEEIFKINRLFGTTHFHFVDDAMAMNKERMSQICQGLLQTDLNITWSMMTRIDSVNEELLALVARAGCTQIDYGVESGHPETLKRIRKPHTVEMVKHIIPLTARFGIKPYVFFILGFPWEDTEAIEATQQLMVELSTYVDKFHPALASILIPFPGTEIYENYKEHYGFEDWWLSEDRCYDAPRLETHSYHETIMYRNGAVLDADFFHYSPDVKQKINEIFKFMYMHNLSKIGSISRLTRQLLFELSERFFAFSPFLERRVFTPIIKRKGITK